MYEHLEIWKRSARLSADLYQYFAASKEWGFRDQITRSGLSVPSNIAEGFERDSDAEKAKFLTYAKGSCGELRTQIYIGMEAGFIDRDIGQKWVAETRELGAMIAAMISKLRASSC